METIIWENNLNLGKAMHIVSRGRVEEVGIHNYECYSTRISRLASSNKWLGIKSPFIQWPLRGKEVKTNSPQPKGIQFKLKEGGGESRASGGEENG